MAHLDPVAPPGQRNPDWIRDEIILALHLYMTNRDRLPNKNSQEVTHLSHLLNIMGDRMGVNRGENYRNPNGVYMKLSNFRRLDPDYIANGRVGLPGGGELEEVIWAEFHNDLPRLEQVAGAIRAVLEAGDEDLTPPDLDPLEEDAEEGRVLTRLHRTRERNKRLVQRKKAAAQGQLRCEACDFDFEARYGERGHGFIEVHHTRPVHLLQPGERTNLTDLALVCSNCHRMIHTRRPWLTMDQLRAILPPR